MVFQINDRYGGASTVAKPKAPARAPAPTGPHGGNAYARPSQASVVEKRFAQNNVNQGGGGGYGGGFQPFYGGGYAPAPPPPPPAPPSVEDYLAGDATYQATISALAKQLENFRADLDMQRQNYTKDFDLSIKNLGFLGREDVEGGDPVWSWNWEDPLTASGRAYQNQVNDFAARNMLQSQGYADALSNLGRSLADQYTGMETARDTFFGDLDRQLSSTTDENNAAQQAARAEAILRRAMQYGLT